MIETKLAMAGRVTGFRAGDKQIQLNWEVEDGVGDFQREDIPTGGFLYKIPPEATMIIFIPGAGPDLSAQKLELANAQEKLNKAKEEVKKLASGDKYSEQDTAASEVAAATLRVTAAKKQLHEDQVRVLVAKENTEEIPISGVYPTIFTSDVGVTGSLKFFAKTGAVEAVDGVAAVAAVAAADGIAAVAEVAAVAAADEVIAATAAVMKNCELIVL